MLKYKTNHVAEAFHWQLQSQLSPIQQFIIEVKKVQAESNVYYEFFAGGYEPPPLPPPYKKKKLKHQTILNLIQNVGNLNIVEYLRGLAHNFVMDY